MGLMEEIIGKLSASMSSTRHMRARSTGDEKAALVKFMKQKWMKFAEMQREGERNLRLLATVQGFVKAELTALGVPEDQFAVEDEPAKDEEAEAHDDMPPEIRRLLESLGAGEEKTVKGSDMSPEIRKLLKSMGIDEDQVGVRYGVISADSDHPFGRVLDKIFEHIEAGRGGMPKRNREESFADFAIRSMPEDIRGKFLNNINTVYDEAVAKAPGEPLSLDAIYAAITKAEGSAQNVGEGEMRQVITTFVLANGYSEVAPGQFVRDAGGVTESEAAEPEGKVDGDDADGPKKGEQGVPRAARREWANRADA